MKENTSFMDLVKGSEPMLQKPWVPPSLQSIKSMPVDFRFIGSPNSDHIEKSDDMNLKHTNVQDSNIPENGKIGNEVVEGVENKESPYCGSNIAAEGRFAAGNEDLESAASPLPSVSASHSDRWWGDTTSYVAKKI